MGDREEVKQAIEFVLASFVDEVNERLRRFAEVRGVEPPAPVRREDLSCSEAERIATKALWLMYRRGREGQRPPRPRSIADFVPPPSSEPPPGDDER